MISPVPETGLHKIVYVSSFQLYTTSQMQLLCYYKQFIENTIMKLGEDWRIESNLLAQEIVAIKMRKAVELAEEARQAADFNIFNEFLSAFLKGKIGNEFDFARHPQALVQEQFLDAVSELFAGEEKIEQSLTFKTLSLGYCITAGDVWSKTFKSAPSQGHAERHIKEFALLSFLTKQAINSGKISSVDVTVSNKDPSDIDTKQNKHQKGASRYLPQHEWKLQWSPYYQENLAKTELKRAIESGKHVLNEAIVLSIFVVHIDQIHTEQTRARVISISNQFYMTAFIVWLVFSIKVFFVLHFHDFKKYVQLLLGSEWQQSFDWPLKHFQEVVEREWNRLLKDYTVALHDDAEVLQILISRVCKEMEDQWDEKLATLRKGMIYE